LKQFIDPETHFGKPRNSEYLMVFSILIISVSWVADIGNDFIQYTFYFFAVMGVFLSGRLLFHRRLLTSMLAVMVITLPILFMQNGFSEWRNQLFFANMALAVLVTGAFRGRSAALMKSYNDILYVLTVLSLIVFPLVFVQKGLLVDIPEFALTEIEFKLNRSLKTLFGLSYFVTNGSNEIWRNQSVFWEPGMMAGLLVLALMFADALGETRKRKSIFIVGILTTFTPGGYFVLAAYLLFKLASTLSRKQLFHLILGITTILVVYLLMPVVRDVVLYLFNRDIQNDPSVLIRSTDVWLPFWAALESPWFGRPNFEEYQLAMYMFIERERGGMTNSLGEYFYRFGIIWAVVWLAIISVSLRNFPNLAGYSFPIIMLMLVYEPIGFSPFVLMLAFGGLNEKGSDSRIGIGVRWGGASVKSGGRSL